jgi:hypothetical protein
VFGRAAGDPKALEKARQALGSGMGINKVARQVGLSNPTVARVKRARSSSAWSALVPQMKSKSSIG